MNNKKTDDQNKSAELYPRLNINFLKVIVIVLGLAIFAIISIIVLKILRGDLNKNNTELTNTSDDFHSEYILELPNIKSIKSIALDNENILIFSGNDDVCLTKTHINGYVSVISNAYPSSLTLS